ncbi:MAG: hypothetical protein JJU41_02065 [Bacteroidetes bacterium]|nr:hypothetical protein [Bacteroidota bacterium]
MITLLISNILIALLTVNPNAYEKNEALLVNFITEQIMTNDIDNGVLYISITPANEPVILGLQSALLKNNITITDNKETANQLVRVYVESDNLLSTISRNTHERSLSADIIVQIVDPSTRFVLSTARSNFSYTDIVHLSDPYILASSWYATHFHNYQDISSRSWIRRFVEPVLIISTVATTAYLLYNVRSQ